MGSINLMRILIIGGVVHLLLGASVYFSKDEPNKPGIVAATTLKGLLVALLVALTIAPDPGWQNGIVYGALYGAAHGLVITLAKGFKSAPYVLVGSIIQGCITGVLIGSIGFPH
jgi:hypothetical protein